jgi:hypothetical protein
MSDTRLPSYTAEQLAANYPTRNDPTILSGPYTPLYVAEQFISEAVTSLAEEKQEHRATLALLSKARTAGENLLAVIEADFRVKRGDYYHERKALKEALK